MLKSDTINSLLQPSQDTIELETKIVNKMKNINMLNICGLFITTLKKFITSNNHLTTDLVYIIRRQLVGYFNPYISSSDQVALHDNDYVKYVKPNIDFHTKLATKIKNATLSEDEKLYLLTELEIATEVYHYIPSIIFHTYPGNLISNSDEFIIDNEIKYWKDVIDYHHDCLFHSEQIQLDEKDKMYSLKGINFDGFMKLDTDTNKIEYTLWSESYLFWKLLSVYLYQMKHIPNYQLFKNQKDNIFYNLFKAVFDRPHINYNVFVSSKEFDRIKTRKLLSQAVERLDKQQYICKDISSNLLTIIKSCLLELTTNEPSFAKDYLGLENIKMNPIYTNADSMYFLYHLVLLLDRQIVMDE